MIELKLETTDRKDRRKDRRRSWNQRDKIGDAKRRSLIARRGGTAFGLKRREKMRRLESSESPIIRKKNF